MSLTSEDRARGALLGLACGDAVGTTLEFRRPGSFEPLTDMVGGGPFGLPDGAWTDDTSMALCLAESLLDTGGFDAGDQLRRYLRWKDDGYLSSTGSCGSVASSTVARRLGRAAWSSARDWLGLTEVPSRRWRLGRHRPPEGYIAPGHKGLMALP